MYVIMKIYDFVVVCECFVVNDYVIVDMEFFCEMIFWFKLCVI